MVRNEVKLLVKKEIEMVNLLAAFVIEVQGHRYVLLRNTGEHGGTGWGTVTEDTTEGPKQPHPEAVMLTLFCGKFLLVKL